jgi:hypothetical protein
MHPPAGVITLFMATTTFLYTILQQRHWQLCSILNHRGDLPLAFPCMHPPAGVITLFLATIISLYTILQLSWMHEQVVDPKTGREVRMNRYHQLTQYTFGECV